MSFEKKSKSWRKKFATVCLCALEYLMPFFITAIDL
jgi:hypothetical protein